MSKIDTDQVDGIGDLTALTTSNKSDLVGAINEVNEEKISKEKTVINTEGWYRIARNKSDRDGRYGESFIVMVQRNYANANNESYTFSINLTYEHATITQLSGNFNSRIITKVRVVNNVLNQPAYVELYYAVNNANIIHVVTIGDGISLPATVAPTPTGSVYEIDTVKGLNTLGGYNINGRTNSDIVLAGGGHRPVSDFALASQLPTVNNGQLTLSTGTGLSGSATFTANQSGNSSFSVGIASTHKLPTTAEWNALPTTNTITRLRGTTSGTYTSGDLTLVNGSGIGIVQSGSNFTITNSSPNATHTGDVTGATALTIANGAVTNAKLANMPANTFKGRLSSAGAPQDLTVTQMRTALGINSGSGIESIRTDNSSSPGPAFYADLYFNFHEYWGFPAAFADETQPGNATAKATDGQLDFFASYDSVQTVIETNGSVDLELKGYHITNVLLMSNGGDVSIEDGMYAGNQVNITTKSGYQINIYANNLIATVGNEVFSFANLIWDCEQAGWILVAYGTP